MTTAMCRHVFTFPLPGWAYCAQCRWHVTIRYDGLRPEWQEPAPPALPAPRVSAGLIRGAVRLRSAPGFPVRLRVPGVTAAACVETLLLLLDALPGARVDTHDAREKGRA